MSERRRYKRYPPELKVRIVLELLQGRKSAAQLCREHEIAPARLSEWQQQFLERASLVFAAEPPHAEEQERIAELERLVGQLTIELAASKKASSLLASR
jgi:transposase-like protein